jgi:hypothetical protein
MTQTTQTQENTIEFITRAPSVRTYTGAELLTGKTYMHDGSVNKGLAKRVITATVRIKTLGGNTIVGADNEGGIWYDDDHTRYGRFFEVQVNMTVTKPV